MYILGFVWFVLSLVKKYYLRQVFFTRLFTSLEYTAQRSRTTGTAYQPNIHFFNAIIPSNLILSHSFPLNFSFSVLALCLDSCCSTLRRHPELPHHSEHVRGAHLVHHAHHDGDHQRHHGLHVWLHDGPHSTDSVESKEDLGRLHRRWIGNRCDEPRSCILHVSGLKKSSNTINFHSNKNKNGIFQVPYFVCPIVYSGELNRI